MQAAYMTARKCPGTEYNRYVCLSPLALKEHHGAQACVHDGQEMARN